MTGETSSEPLQYYVRTRGRITGPFSIDRLIALKNRGRIGKTQQLSSDRINWIPASKVPELFGPPPIGNADLGTAQGDAAVGFPNTDQAALPVVGGNEPDLADPFAEVVAPANEPAADANWYYYHDNEQQGPMTLDVMRTLIKGGQIKRDTQVFHDGATDWLPASHYSSLDPRLGGSLPSRGGSRRWFLVGSGAAVVACGGAAAFAPQLFNSWRSYAIPRTSMNQALGKVYVGVVVTSAVGVKSESGSPTGTAFRIDDQGHLLTTRSVVRPFLGTDFAAKLKQFKDAGAQAKPTIWVFFGDEKTTAEIVHTTDDDPFAILKCDAKSDAFFALSSSDDYSKRAEVVSHGFPGQPETPLGESGAVSDLINEPDTLEIESSIEDDDLEYLTDRGEIRRFVEDELGEEDDEDAPEMWLIQSDCGYSLCSRGGPLLDEHGVVIGLNDDVGEDAGDKRTSVAVFQFQDDIDDVAKDEDFEVTWVS